MKRLAVTITNYSDSNKVHLITVDLLLLTA